MELIMSHLDQTIMVYYLTIPESQSLGAEWLCGSDFCSIMRISVWSEDMFGFGESAAKVIHVALS